MNHHPALDTAAGQRRLAHHNIALRTLQPTVAPASQRIAHQANLHSCPRCRQSFSTARDRDRHFATLHSLDRPYSCLPCQRSFARQDHLQRHQRSRQCQSTRQNQATDPLAQDCPIPSSTAHEQQATSDPPFQRLIQRFHDKYNLELPNIPCAHCGGLNFMTTMAWMPHESDAVYNLAVLLHHELYRSMDGDRQMVAVCTSCKRQPQRPPFVKLWPTVLLSVPQRSRMFLSPLRLMTNLGKQHGATSNPNPFLTYRSMTGMESGSIIYIIYDDDLPNKCHIGRMYFSSNERALALYSGTLGAYLESSSHLHDADHDHPLLQRAADWLIQYNPLYQRWHDGIGLTSELNLPIMNPMDDQETRPSLRPEIIMNPEAYDVETGNEDFQTHRRPATMHMTRQGQAMTNDEPEQEMLLFPCLYPWGTGAWQRADQSLHERSISTLASNAKLKLNNIVSHFRDDYYWPHYIYMRIEETRIFQHRQRIMSSYHKRRVANRLTRRELLQQSNYSANMILNESITRIVPASIRTGDEFFINAEAKIRAMIRGFGYPHLFITLTFSEGWKSYLQLLRTTGNLDPLPSNRPWEAVQFYYRRYQNLKDKLLRNRKLSGFGAMREFAERHEFQQRGAIHTHSLLWVQKPLSDLISEEFIRADLPDATTEPELHQLVIRHQIHTCSGQLCRKDCNDAIQCRKGFPADLSSHTHQKAGELRFTYKQLNDADRWVVPYAPRILLIWDAHCNVQYCTSGGLAKYISKYVTKPEPKGIYSPNKQDSISQHIMARRLGSMEVMALLLSKPIFHVSSNSIYLSTATPQEALFCRETGMDVTSAG